MANQPSDADRLEQALAKDIAGLSDADARIALRAAQRDLERRQREATEHDRKVAQMAPNEFERWKREVGG